MESLPGNPPRVRDKHKLSRQVRRLKKEPESWPRSNQITGKMESSQIRDKHKLSRQVRRLKKEPESCITLSAFRKFVRRACQILSSKDASRRISATKGFLLNLRSLVATHAVQECQRAGVFLRASSKTTLDGAAMALADLEERAATDPVVHNLCEAVAGDSSETRDAAKTRFYDLDWCIRRGHEEQGEEKAAVRHDYSQTKYRLVKYRTKAEAEKSVMIDRDPFESD